MSNFQAKRGSALLIVLGFLSFMVVSAVAFAMYMRAERVPSSALRRNVAVRHLVEAALAQAMSRVDDAVRDDPFPGLIDKNAQDQYYRDNNNCAYDWWEGRVFMPPDPEGSTRNEGNDHTTRFAPAAETVSVLNLEALGYLPPALINDVRFLSRASWAAKWEYFNYDAGRYAFCAVNVSDFFDINRMSAGPRTSADPVSLAYLFANGARETTPDTTGPDSFERLVETQRPSGTDGGSVNKVPYVSMLDYNLAFGKMYNSGFGKYATFESPFWNWINNKPNAQSGYMYIYNTRTTAAKNLIGAERQPFVTDSWFPSDSVTFKLLNVDGANRNIPDLADSDENSKHYGQPFKMSELRNSNALGVEKVLERSQTKGLPFWCDYQKNGEQKGILKHFGAYDALCLWDYLDRDNVPLSLAMPCAERVPMICSAQMGLNSGDKLLTVKSTTTPPPEPGSGPWSQITEYTLEGVLDKAGAPHVRALIAYPFKGFDCDGYRAKAYAQLHVTAVGNADDITKISLPTRLYRTDPPMKEYLDNGFDAGGSEMLAGGVWMTTLAGDSETAISIDAPEREADIFSKGKSGSERLTLRKPGKNSAPIIRKVQQRGSPTAENPSGPAIGDPVYTVLVNPLDLSGQAAVNVAGVELTPAKLSELKFAVTAAVWVRIEDTRAGKWVDLMPATYDDDDDRVLGQGSMPSIHYADEHAAGPKNNPGMLRFAVTQPFEFKSICDQIDAQNGSEVDVVEVHSEFSPQAYMAVDPRFNWAPEDLLALSRGALGGTEVTGQVWLDKVFGSSGFARECGDGEPDVDPFMFVSNQGYLQSMGELAFLPKINNGGGGDWLRTTYDGVPKSGVGDLAHVRSMWQGNPILSENNRQTVYDWGVEDTRGHFRVNPYTDNSTIFMSVFANTPMNYWASGTNDLSGGQVSTVDSSTKQKMLKSSSEWKKYVFGPDNDFNLEIRYDDLERLATQFRQGLAATGVSGGADSWIAAYNALWNSDDGLFYKSAGDGESEARKLLGLNLGGSTYLHGADRKFLYSFWRECFGNRQQLFLMFVRAESTALGGTGEGTPPQQGGRAVALVWRDPNRPTGRDVHEDKDNTFWSRRHPHKMRVLFYHQFD